MLLAEGELAAARAQIDIGLQSSPKEHHLWNLLGRYFRKMGNNVDANNCYKYAIKLGSYEATLELKNKEYGTNDVKNYEEAVAKLEAVHKLRIEAVGKLKKEEGIDILEAQYTALKQEHDELRNRRKELEADSNRPRVKIRASGRYRAIQIGNPNFRAILYDCLLLFPALSFLLTLLT